MTRVILSPEELILDQLKDQLNYIELYDSTKNYKERNKFVLLAVMTAKQLGLEAGFRPADDCDNSKWYVAYIELPTGQVAWHVPFDAFEYDGHTTEEKYQRINEFRKWGWITFRPWIENKQFEKKD